MELLLNLFSWSPCEQSLAAGEGGVHFLLFLHTHILSNIYTEDLLNHFNSTAILKSACLLWKTGATTENMPFCLEKKRDDVKMEDFPTQRGGEGEETSTWDVQTLRES